MAKRSNYDAEYIWEQQENESAEAYEAFSLYRDGYETVVKKVKGNEVVESKSKENCRSLQKVSQKLAKSLPLIKRWSSRHDWVYRVREYDKFIEREALDKATESLAKMRTKQILLGSELQNKAFEALKEVPKKLLIANPQILLAFIKEGAAMETRARKDEQEAHRPTQHESAEDEALQKLDDILGRIKSGF